jgi:hypothetical protein
MAQVFVSFIHEEENIAERVQVFVTEVLGDTIRPFLASDTSQLYAGDLWLDRIKEELQDAKVIILMLSRRSVKKPWINFEAGAGWIKEVKIIPVCFSGMRKDKLPKPYSSYQALNLISDEDQYYLVKSIAGHLDLPTPPPGWYSSEQMGILSVDNFKNISKPYKKLRFWIEKLLGP